MSLNAFKSEFSDLIKEPELEIISFKTDPLVLSCCLKRINNLYYKLSGSELEDKVEPCDYAQAEKIRKYYSKKFFWIKLRTTTEFPSFRQRALELLSINQYNICSSDIGIFVRLPWFYEEDMLHDTLKSISIQSLTNPREQVTKGLTPTQISLKPVGTSLRWFNKRLFENFWFIDENKFLYKIELPSDNPLLDIFRDEINKEEINFLTKFTFKTIEGFCFFPMQNYKIIKEK